MTKLQIASGIQVGILGNAMWPQSFWWAEEVSPGSFTPNSRDLGEICGSHLPGKLHLLHTWFWMFPETNGTVQLELRVTNREFTADLQNSSSPGYKEFVQHFTKQVKGHENPPGVGVYLVEASQGPGMDLGVGDPQNEVRGEGVQPSQLEASSLPDERDLRHYRGLQGHRGAEPQVSRDGDFGVIPWGKKKRGSLDVQAVFAGQAWERRGGPHHHRVPGGDVAERGEAPQHHGQSAGEDRGGGDAAQLHQRYLVPAGWGQPGPSVGWGAPSHHPKPRWEGLWGCPTPNSTSPAGDLCFNSSEVVITETQLDFDEEGEWVEGGTPGFGGSPKSPPS